MRTRRPRQPVRRERPIRTGRADQPLLLTPSIALRVAILVGLGLVMVAVILFRLWFLQVLSAERYMDAANDNRLRSVKVVAPRGAIVDRDGEVIVENRPGLAVGIRPMDVPEGRLEAVTTRLAKVLGMRPRKIRRALEEYGGYPYDLVVLKEDVSRGVVSRILERKDLFPGVEVRRTYLRAYPHGDLAAHLLGHLGEIDGEQLKQPAYRDYSAGDVIGQGGVESAYDRWLRGRDGVAKIEVDAFGRPKGSAPVGGRLAEPGDTLVLTLDADVQQAAERAVRYGVQLAHANRSWAANGGAAVVLDVRNGEVLAMASYPSFDPEVYVGGLSEKDWARLSKPSANNPIVNKAAQGLYAPGSTYKAIDAVAALEEGVISPYTRFYCNGRFPPSGELGKTYWNCWLRGGHGHDNVTEALSESCDVFFYNVGYAFYKRPGSELAEWSVRLGLGRPTGLDIPGEAKGLVPTPEWRQEYFESEVDKIWKPGNSILMAIGQGDLQVTPLQMAVAYATIANGGTVVQPHLARKVLTPQGEVRREFEFEPRREVEISTGTLEQVRKGLRMAATQGTSAAVFAGYPVAVAGKTGTAEVYGKGDYAWYASYAPFDEPRYAVVVMIEQGGHGGAVAAPAARVIYDALFGLDTGLSTGATGTD